MDTAEPSQSLVHGYLSELKLADAVAGNSHPVSRDLPLGEYLFRTIARPAFRRSRLDEPTACDVQAKILRALDDGSPVAFSIPFGGYKSHNSGSFPLPDWAEVFNLNYIWRFVSPIAETYPPGVVVEYTYTSGVMDLVSNLPPGAADAYMVAFRDIMAFFAAVMPRNVRFVATDLAADPGAAGMMDELLKHYEENRRDWLTRLSQAERDRRFASAQRNLMPTGNRDLSQLSPSQWDDACVEAAMMCEAVDRLSFRRRYNKQESRIELVFVRGPSLAVHVGSCDTSSHHFWSGVGSVEYVDGSRLVPRIMSQRKLSAVRDQGLAIDCAVSGFEALGEHYKSVPVLLPGWPEGVGVGNPDSITRRGHGTRGSGRRAGPVGERLEGS